MTRFTALMFAGAMLASAAPAAAQQTAQEQVFATERAFAATMAARDLQAFSTFIAEEAIFFSGDMLRGKEAVVAGWAPLYKDAAAPFSWEPDQVEVLESGTLALSTGIVRNPAGESVSRFDSIWRLEADGVWRIIFDKGSPLGPAEQP